MVKISPAVKKTIGEIKKEVTDTLNEHFPGELVIIKKGTKKKELKAIVPIDGKRIFQLFIND